jgi:ribose transport system substrate-binding protein
MTERRTATRILYATIIASACAGLLARAALAASPEEDVARAKQALAAYTTAATKWTGPTSGPKLEAGKSVVVVGGDMKNPGIATLAQAVQRIGTAAGWTVTILDGQGTTTGQQSAMTQAIALKPAGMVVDGMPDAFRPYYSQAKQQGIAVVGLTSAPDSGAFPQFGIDWNVMQKVSDLGKALADWVIVRSGGKARVILISDRAYGIVEAKVAAMRAEFGTCGACKIVLDTQVPFADANTRLPQLVPTWLSTYGLESPLYIAHPADYFITFEIPPLRSAGVQQGQVVLAGMDGNPPIYQRIRADDSYQEATIPFPYEMQAYQAIDELNRVIAGTPPIDFSSPIYVIDKSNVDTAGGKNNEFVPESDYARHYRELWQTGSTSP